MTINGSYSNFSTGTLDLQVAGPNPADADHLVVNGTATVAGYLELDFINTASRRRPARPSVC